MIAWLTNQVLVERWTFKVLNWIGSKLHWRQLWLVIGGGFGLWTGWQIRTGDFTQLAGITGGLGLLFVIFWAMSHPDSWPPDYYYEEIKVDADEILRQTRIERTWIERRSRTKPPRRAVVN